MSTRQPHNNLTPTTVAGARVQSLATVGELGVASYLTDSLGLLPLSLACMLGVPCIILGLYVGIWGSFSLESGRAFTR